MEPAHARIGLRFYYELRTLDAFVTRVVKASTAGRVGLKSGDQILRIKGKDVSRMQEGDAQSLINANASVGVALTVKHADGRIEDVTVKVYEKMPHNVFDIVPDRCVDDLLAFLGAKFGGPESGTRAA